MDRINLSRAGLFRLAVGLLVLGAANSVFGVPPKTCDQVKAGPDAWVNQSVTALVVAARGLYENDYAEAAYERALDGITRTMQKCRMAEDATFAARYPEFIGFVKTLSLERLPDHELGFNVPDRVYFAETRALVAIPEDFLTPDFLRAVSRFATLPKAKAILRELNAHRAPNDQLIFFSYQSRHLGTPDNPDSFWRLLIVVPANTAQGTPEKWVQFGVPDPQARALIRNVSVVAVQPGPDGTSNAYFKDYFRNYRRNGSITIKGRWELGEGDDNCAMCHKSGVLPIFPVKGSVARDELESVRQVNERFMKYGRPRFGKYLDATELGPGLGATSETAAHMVTKNGVNDVKCSACHQPNGLGALNWPMDRVLISSYVNGGQMPFGFELTNVERRRLYARLIKEYFATDEAKPGILKSWLLGRSRPPAVMPPKASANVSPEKRPGKSD